MHRRSSASSSVDPRRPMRRLGFRDVYRRQPRSARTPPRAMSRQTFESSIPRGRTRRKHTAAATTAASAPRPASSAPATRVIPARGAHVVTDEVCRSVAPRSVEGPCDHERFPDHLSSGRTLARPGGTGVTRGIRLSPSTKSIPSCTSRDRSPANPVPVSRYARDPSAVTKSTPRRSSHVSPPKATHA